MPPLAEGILFVVVVVAFVVALYARHRMLRPSPRPGYVHDRDDAEPPDPEAHWYR